MATQRTETEEVRERLREEFPYWAEKFARIVDKRGRRIPFHLKPGQLALDEQLEAQRQAGRPMRAIVLKARQVGFCLDPETRVLTDDLRWVEIDRLRPGARLVAVDEMPPGGHGRPRRMRTAEVEGAWEVHEPAFELPMSNGQRLIATAQHRFLCKVRGAVHTEWRAVGDLRPGDEIRHVTEPWSREPDAQDGWFAGIIDGEGCFREKKGELNVSQCFGPVYEAARLYLENGGYSFREEVDHRSLEDRSKLGDRPVGRLIVGRMNEMFRLLGMARTARFRGLKWWEGRELPGKRSGVAWARVEAIRPLGPRRMIDIQTSTQTFLAEGFVSHNSTVIQGKLVHRCTLRERYDALTIAHNLETAGKLYRMAETIYAGLPNDSELKPALGQHRRQRFLHFTGDSLWQQGQNFPDSRYSVDTAAEKDAGRGGTYRAIHASEVAFWERINEKLTALTSAVPDDDPETLFIQESTANGFNEFRDWWLDAEEGRSEWIAFFWPWWKEFEYVRHFASEAERERFIVGDPTNPYAEEEAELEAHHGLSAEQLHWRRHAIANKFGGDVRKFHQEMPSTPEEAFLTTGQKVFDAYRSAQLVVRTELTDPRTPDPTNPGPTIGDLRPTHLRTEPTLSGTIEVPGATRFERRAPGIANLDAPWRFWLPEDDDGSLIRNSEYVMGVDVSGGRTETTQEPDYHAIEVIDHRTREQVAEYRSRIEPRLLVLQILLGALFFNEALVAIERTGSWGMAPLSILYNDFHYPFLYRSRKTGTTADRVERRLGWDTNLRTKPLLLAGFAELMRIEEDGIKSRALAGEIRTYTRTEKGTTEAEPGKYDDLLMAYMIAQEVAKLSPLRGPDSGSEATEAPFVAHSGVRGYGSVR